MNSCLGANLKRAYVAGTFALVLASVSQDALTQRDSMTKPLEFGLLISKIDQY